MCTAQVILRNHVLAAQVNKSRPHIPLTRLGFALRARFSLPAQVEIAGSLSMCCRSCTVFLLLLPSLKNIVRPMNIILCSNCTTVHTVRYSCKSAYILRRHDIGAQLYKYTCPSCRLLGTNSCIVSSRHIIQSSNSWNKSIKYHISNR